LATIDKDGFPHLPLTWVDTDGQYILVNTVSKSEIRKNAKRIRRVAIALLKPGSFEMLRLRGEVVQELRGQVAEDHLEGLLKRHQIDYATFMSRAEPSKHVPRRVILKIVHRGGHLIPDARREVGY
jgi:siroheme synthase (precorrin-2 oxidase/ferrochelatase)